MKRTALRRKSKTPLAKLKDQLWQLCREITFKRYGNDCYTCDAKNLTGSNRQCGHFIASSVCSSSLRYDLGNLRPQCAACNIWKSGNWLAFENHLKEDGIDVEELKRRNEQTKGLKYDELWYKEKIEEYSALV